MSTEAAFGDLSKLLSFASSPEALDLTFRHALAALAKVVPYDLAALYELHGDTLVLRVGEGRLASKVRGHTLPLARFPSIRRALTVRQPMVLAQHDHEGDEGDPYDGVLDLPPGHSCMVIPLYSADRALGIITLDATACGNYTESTSTLCNVYGQLVSMAMVLAHQSAEVETARALLEEQNRVLVDEVGGVEQACRRLEASESPVMKAVVRLAKQVAVTDSYVVIHGETGSGKEVLAQAIHAWSPRHKGPMVKLNCGAIPENLVESELFGHVKGAFTGAVKSRPGRFLAASGGTLFLDEIGDMPLAVQTKLLRTLQEKTVEPVGSDEVVPVDVRVIVASHVDLEAAVREGRFREDLYYRLAVFPIELPPLRERREDILPLAWERLRELTMRAPHGRGPWIFTEEAKDALKAESWPGNVRQLVNAIERATIVNQAGAIDVADLGLRASGRGGRAGITGTRSTPPAPLATSPTSRTSPTSTTSPTPGSLASLRDAEEKVLARALATCKGKVYGKDGAAALLGLPPTTLQSKMKKLGLR